MRFLRFCKAFRQHEGRLTAEGIVKQKRMLFREVIGQEGIKKKLVATVDAERIGHAWLFFGPEGSGKLPLVLAFARYISCLDRKGQDSCESCSSCRKYSKFIHPDLHFSFPVNKTKTVTKDNFHCEDFMDPWREFLHSRPYGGLMQWYDMIGLENMQGIINTDESRRIASIMAYKPYESDYKISIIWQADRMSAQAASRLLKLIEEPPPFTIFLLISENPDQILPTMRSRCIQVKIPRIEDAELTDALIRFHALDEQSAANTARIASGNYQKALKLVQDTDECIYSFLKFRDLMRACYQNSIPEMARNAEELASQNRERQKSFLEYSLSMIRESLALHYDHEEIVYLPDEELDFAVKFAPFVSGGNVMQLQEELTKACLDIERNANGRIVFFDLALKISSLLKRP